MTVRTPDILLHPVWPPPRSLATTGGISVDVFSSPYLDVSVQAVPHVNLWIQLTLTDDKSAGLPHSEISGSKLICSSPKLIAAYHVFRRLLMPRHSPCALYSLTCRRGNSLRSVSGAAFRLCRKLHIRSFPLLLREKRGFSRFGTGAADLGSAPRWSENFGSLMNYADFIKCFTNWKLYNYPSLIYPLLLPSHNLHH